MASEAAWLKIVPRAIAEGLTGGRSGKRRRSICFQASSFLTNIAKARISRCVEGDGREGWNCTGKMNDSKGRSTERFEGGIKDDSTRRNTLTRDARCMRHDAKVAGRDTYSEELPL